MRTHVAESIVEERVDDLLSTGEAARLLGTSRQHVVDLCNRGDLRYLTVGSHRRIRRGDLDAASAGSRRLSRDQRRSLWLAHGIAGKLVIDPDHTLALARVELGRLRGQHTRGQAARWLKRSQALIDGPVEPLLEMLTSPSPVARELRQNSPFAAVMTARERERILAAFGEATKAGKS